MGGEFTYQPKWDPIGFDPQPCDAVVVQKKRGHPRKGLRKETCSGHILSHRVNTSVSTDAKDQPPALHFSSQIPSSPRSLVPELRRKSAPIHMTRDSLDPVDGTLGATGGKNHSAKKACPHNVHFEGPCFRLLRKRGVPSMPRLPKRPGLLPKCPSLRAIRQFS